MPRTALVSGMLLAIATALFSGPTAAETPIALVIGNGAYPTAPLESPSFDRRAIAQKLRNLGFSVTERQDLTRTQLFEAISQFGETLTHPDTIGLFYYSGHGIQMINRNYLVPVDPAIYSESDVELFGIPLDNVLQRMEIANSKPNIIILDACRDNPFEKRYKSLRGSTWAYG
jgi:uncharacterized caspase-like protein